LCRRRRRVPFDGHHNQAKSKRCSGPSATLTESAMPSHTLTAFPPELLAAKKQIREQARSYCLDFFPVIFEMCDYEQMNQIAAYGGFPPRNPHWKFGADYEGLRKRHHYGLGRIYEMVINNDPCYAYLQESNQLVDQKLVIAHVYGHADFF